MLIQPSTPAFGTGRPELAPRETVREVPAARAMQEEAAPVEPNTQAVKAAVEASNRVVQLLQSKIEFVTDDSSGRMVIKVFDSSSNELIRQIPSEEMLAISRALDRMQGLLVKSEA
ncbi:MAG: flagellar protein FlaG [Betaproteobacteria bacterium]|jgi:flagellar protein FlaG|nr:flagellar protein FlaG [Betaproteobacteria bacterium]